MPRLRADPPRRWAFRGILADARALSPLSDSARHVPPACHDTDPPVRKGWTARSMTSHRRIRMNRDVLRETPHPSAQARGDAPDSMLPT